MSYNDSKHVSCESYRKGSMYPYDLLKEIKDDDEYGLPNIDLSYLEIGISIARNTEFELLVDEYEAKNEDENSNEAENETIKKELYPFKELRQIDLSMGMNIDDIG